MGAPIKQLNHNNFIVTKKGFSKLFQNSIDIKLNKCYN